MDPTNHPMPDGRPEVMDALASLNALDDDRAKAACDYYEKTASRPSYG